MILHDRHPPTESRCRYVIQITAFLYVLLSSPQAQANIWSRGKPSCISGTPLGPYRPLFLILTDTDHLYRDLAEMNSRVYAITETFPPLPFPGDLEVEAALRAP